MQLKEPIYIRGALAAATCGLLGSVPNNTQALGTDTPWQFDVALLYYTEADNRVNAIEPLLRARKELGDEEFITFKAVFDSLTGASPSGAMPSSVVQTFTRASGNSTYVIQPNTLPLDDTFLDTRTQLSAEWEKPLGRLSKGIFGANFSTEYDFTSIGLSALFTHDINQRNTTLSAGLSYESDTIEPDGGVPIELAPMLPAGFQQNRRGDSEDRTQADLLLGLTQVISRRTLMQFNYSYSQSDGYHTDPFKLISRINDTSGPMQGNPIEHIFENRPATRNRHILYWKTLHHLEKDIIAFSYRYLSDDWEIHSHTLDFHYTWMTQQGKPGTYWQPHLRFYQQNAAEFYRTNLYASEAVPVIVSADYRLGDMSGVTLGLKYFRPLEHDRSYAIRLEYLTQNNDPSDGSRIGNLQNAEIVPQTNAVILQFHYSF